MDSKLAKICYCPRATRKASLPSKVPEDVVKLGLFKQAIWRIYLPAPRYVSPPKFDVATLNSVHQVDLLFLLNDKIPRGRKIYKHALTAVDVASRY